MGQPVFGGRFALVKQIGERHGTKIFLAHDEQGLPCAVEVMAAGSRGHVRLLHKWAKTLAATKDPGLPEICGYGKEGDAFYLAREYVKGTNLKTLAAGAPMDALAAAKHILQVSAALARTHRVGIVHGDLRPHNLILTPEGVIKVIDFAMPSVTAAKFVRPDGPPEFWHHASPEEAREQPLMPSSDVYSLGVVYYELVTGVVPFDGYTAQEVKTAHVLEEPVAPRRRNVNIPLAIEGIILRALHKDPNTRYSSMEQLRWDLGQVVRQLDPPAPEVPTKATLPGPARSRRPGI